MMIHESTHKFPLDTNICEVCGHTAEEIEDGLIPVECPGAPDKFVSPKLDMSFVTPEWLAKHGDLEPSSGCSACGLIAGCCQNYPDCPGGEEQKHENGDGV